MQATNLLTLPHDMKMYACLCLQMTCHVPYAPYFLLHITSAGLDPRLPSELP